MGAYNPSFYLNFLSKWMKESSKYSHLKTGDLTNFRIIKLVAGYFISQLTT